MAESGSDSEASQSLNDEKDEKETGCGSYPPCQWLGPVGVDMSLQRRRMVLKIAMGLIAVGSFLTTLAVWGAFSSPKTGLSLLRWMTIEKAVTVGAHELKQEVYAGAKYFCTFGNLGDKCDEISDMQCSKLPHEDLCKGCQERAKKMLIPVVIAFLTYLKLFKGTYDRYVGKDSNCAKFGDLFSTLVGNTNFIFALVQYNSTCVLQEVCKCTSRRAGWLCMGQDLYAWQ
eukprot:TRINITY_DN10048_c0_g1_i3.p1 TRINITY_DN10048_c0_g1~~TRINITY_DN10048_c0_g1_i3.p1  ORF type:complete len:247 (-),score=27.38 TRINITY_DN10048_c0_g1_i3:138-824(-)